MDLTNLYVSAGLAYWLAYLAVHGEPEGMRALAPWRRLEIHLVAVGLSLALWPIALVQGMRRDRGT